MPKPSFYTLIYEKYEYHPKPFPSKLPYLNFSVEFHTNGNWEHSTRDHPGLSLHRVQPKHFHCSKDNIQTVMSELNYVCLLYVASTRV